MVHMAVDNDERIEKSCNKCKNDMEDVKCVSCGSKMETLEENPQFDEELFEKLKKQAT